MSLSQHASDDCRKVIRAAMDEAVGVSPDAVLSDAYTDTEHLLLAILKFQTKALTSLLTAEEIRTLRTQTEQRINQLPKLFCPSRPPYSNQLRAAFEHSLAESIRLKCETVEIEHLLLGLLRLGVGNAFQLLTEFGISSEQVEALLLTRQDGEPLRDSPG